jgi:DNA-binding NarL/FixJ family response regulator
MSPNIHVMHTLPAMSAGLATMLQSRDWLVSVHARRPERLAAADIVVVDYATGVDLAKNRARRPGAAPHVLVVTRRDQDGDVRRALKACVDGYLLEDTDARELQEAVRSILAGSCYVCAGLRERIAGSRPAERLTNRESDVLRLLAKGLCNKLIARDLGIEVGTVKWHVSSLFCKLGVSARTQAVVVAAQRGLVGIDLAVPG